MRRHATSVEARIKETLSALSTGDEGGEAEEATASSEGQ
jgi:hypothetical protein